MKICEDVFLGQKLFPESFFIDDNMIEFMKENEQFFLLTNIRRAIKKENNRTIKGILYDSHNYKDWFAILKNEGNREHFSYMGNQYFIDRIEGEKMGINDRLNKIKNNVTVNSKLNESNLTNVENTYIFQDLNFESIFTELEIQDIEFLKQQTLSYFSIGSKTKTMLGKILYDAQIRLADKVGAFLKWSEGVLNIKKSTSYNLINRYQFILNNPNHKDIIEALPLTISYELSISEDNDLIQEIFNKNIVDVKEIKAFLKKETILEDKAKKNEEPEIVESPFEEIFEKTFFDIKTKFDNIEESKQKKVKKLLNEIEKIINI